MSVRGIIAYGYTRIKCKVNLNISLLLNIISGGPRKFPGLLRFHVDISKQSPQAIKIVNI